MELKFNQFSSRHFAASSTHSLGIPNLYERVERDGVFAADHVSYRLELFGEIDLSFISKLRFLLTCESVNKLPFRNFVIACELGEINPPTTFLNDTLNDLSR